VIEAKKETLGQSITAVEEETAEYAAAKLKYIQHTGIPLPFLYEATGVLTRFTDQRDPKPRSREVFSFHRPETLRAWLAAPAPGLPARSLRARLHDLPALDPTGLRACQIEAITNLEASLKDARPRAVIQMATGSGKTFTAITSIYRLLKHARVRRVLFLVDTRNLGEQAEQEFLAFTPNDDNRKFTVPRPRQRPTTIRRRRTQSVGAADTRYTVARLASSHLPTDAEVYISTIQRMYSILQGEELDASAEDENPAERSDRKREPIPVAYSAAAPPEFFDLIVIDECHRSIYNLWQQVLDYFDAFLVGLTAPPDARAYGFFRQNVVSGSAARMRRRLPNRRLARRASAGCARQYTHEKAVADGVNVQGEIYVIETDVSRNGGLVLKGLVEKRERLTRARRWQQQDQDEDYSAKKLDRDIVNPSQLRTVIRTFRDKLPEIFPDRRDVTGAFEVPKTLIFAKTDHIALIDAQGNRTHLPEALFAQFARIVRLMSERKAIVLVPEDEAFTTQAAANYLGVSRQHLVDLLEKKEIPYHKVGTHRRVTFKDLLAYERKRDTTRREALDKLAAEADAAGLYDSDHTTTGPTSTTR
jgi:type I restriction enzyme R subunit